MAHLFSLASTLEPPNYKNGLKSSSQTKFPSTPFFNGFNTPSRFDASVRDLAVTGVIPTDLNGTFYRIQPDPRYPPLYEEDIHFSGDGAVSAFRFENGHVDFTHKYVETDRLKAEAKARKGLFGMYRNPFTDNEAVKGVIRTVSNTNVVFWRGVLLAMKEDGPPFAMDPLTLETLGRYDFEGQVLSPTFTAHPKFDPETGEMVCFAYEAGGDGHDASCEVVVYTIDKHGKKTEECWYEAPFCGMIHDCGLSKNYLILPLTPLKVDLERLKKGGRHFAWDPNEDQWYGIVPRRGGKREDIVWLRADNGFHGHIAGCYETSDGKVILDLTVATDNVFFWFPPDPSSSAGSGAPSAGPPPGKRPPTLRSQTFRWILDPKLPSGSRITPHEIFPDTNGEFSRIDDRFVTKPYEHFWQVQIDPTKPYDIQKCGPPAGGLFNVLGHFSWGDLDHSHNNGQTNGTPHTNGNTNDKHEKDTNKTHDVFWAGPTTTFQEPQFVPKSGASKEGEGYLLTLLNHLDELRNDICIFDALNLAQGPLAVVHLPFKLKMGLHGSWVDDSEVESWRARGEEKAKVAEGLMEWQKKFWDDHGQGGENGVNGKNGQTNGHNV